MAFSKSTARFDRSFALSKRREAIDSLVAVANTSAPNSHSKAAVGNIASTGKTKSATLDSDRDVVINYLKSVKAHRATVSEVAKGLGLPSNRLADALLAAKMDGLLNLASVSGETVATVVMEEDAN